MKNILIGITSLFLGFALITTTANAGERWRSDWGVVDVLFDNSGTFIAYYSAATNGIIKMKPQGNGRYAGYWARDCGSERAFCDYSRTKANGSQSHCWGTIRGSVNYSDTEFKGSWMGCNGIDGGRWNGSKIQ